MHSTRIVLAFLTVSLTCVITAAADDPRSVDSILVDSQRSANATTSFDARFTRLTIDRTFGTEERDEGRVFWDSSGHAAYQVEGKCHLAWSDKGFVSIDFTTNSYVVRTPAEFERAARRLSELSQLSGMSGFWQFLQWIEAFNTGARIDDVLPLLRRDDVVATKQHYELTWQRHEQGFQITAVPKDRSQESRISQIDLLFDPQISRILAHRTIDLHRREVVHIFTHVVANELPADREQLLAPSPSGLKEMFPEKLDQSIPADSPSSP